VHGEAAGIVWPARRCKQMRQQRCLDLARVPRTVGVGQLVGKVAQAGKHQAAEHDHPGRALLLHAVQDRFEDLLVEIAGGGGPQEDAAQFDDRDLSVRQAVSQLSAIDDERMGLCTEQLEGVLQHGEW
jgi:hypothetical protein